MIGEYPKSEPPRLELREPSAVLEKAPGTGLEHLARIKPREFRALGLAPKSDVVAVTDKIKAKIAARGLTAEIARRVIEEWEYQRRSPSEARSVERYAQIDGRWYFAVIYVPGKKEPHPHNSLATAYRIKLRHIEPRLESGQLRKRK